MKLFYKRYVNKNNEIDNFGGLTFVYDFENDNQIIKYGVARCNKSDRFDKKIGSNVSLKDFKENPKTLSFSDTLKKDITFSWADTKLLIDVLSDILYIKGFRHDKMSKYSENIICNMVRELYNEKTPIDFNWFVNEEINNIIFKDFSRRISWKYEMAL